MRHGRFRLRGCHSGRRDRHGNGHGTITAPPTRVTDDAVETFSSQSIEIDVLANDGDPALRIDAVGAAKHGATCIWHDLICYTPDAAFEGPDGFSYVAADPCGASFAGWVDVTVLRENHPPIADAGGFYQGTAGSPVELRAGFSRDPDPGDRLEYRWDLDNDGAFDTDWSADPAYRTIYDSAYVGRVVLEVRDLYRDLPAGGLARDTALVRVDRPQSIQALVFEDLDGDGGWTEEEPGIAGMNIALAGDTHTTAVDGRVSFPLEAGLWTVALTEGSILELQDRGLRLSAQEWIAWLGRGENVLITFPASAVSTPVAGVVYYDANGDGALDEEDPRIGGVTVLLDDQERSAVLTDGEGRFGFLDVPFGPHRIRVVEGDPGARDVPRSLYASVNLGRPEPTELRIAWPFAP